MRARLALLLLVVACGSESQPATTVVPAPDGKVAISVGEERVTAASIAAIAREQSVPIEEATERALFDAVLAAKARQELSPGHVQQLVNTVLARALWTQEWNELVKPPIRPEELEEATQAFWLLYARPEGRRTAHAVVHANDEDSEQTHVAARALAERILEEVREPVDKAKDEPAPKRTGIRAYGADAYKSDPLLKAFTKAANRAKAGSQLKVTVQELPSVAKDSLQLAAGAPPGSGFDPKYTAGAWKLNERGELSGIVKSSFGYHVIVLLEVTPANMLSRDELEAVLGAEILKVRGTRRRRALLAELDAVTPAEIAANHAALLALIRVEEGADVLEDTP